MTRREFLLNLGIVPVPIFLGRRLGWATPLASGAGGLNDAVARRRLKCEWQSRKNKYLCDLSAGNQGPFDFSELFVNGKLQTRARFPNCDPAQAPGGYARAVRGIPAGASSPDPVVEPYPGPRGVGIVGIEFDPETFSTRRWAKPEEAILHLYPTPASVPLLRRILSLDYDRNLIWFDYRDSARSNSSYADLVSIDQNSQFFVDNVYEEMDAPGEWYLSRQSNSLYFRPPPDLDMDRAVFEIPD
jgi:hypothetical protein